MGACMDPNPSLEEHHFLALLGKPAQFLSLACALARQSMHHLLLFFPLPRMQCNAIQSFACEPVMHGSPAKTDSSATYKTPAAAARPFRTSCCLHPAPWTPPCCCRVFLLLPSRRRFVAVTGSRTVFLRTADPKPSRDMAGCRRRREKDAPTPARSSAPEGCSAAAEEETGSGP